MDAATLAEQVRPIRLDRFARLRNLAVAFKDERVGKCSTTLIAAQHLSSSTTSLTEVVEASTLYSLRSPPIAAAGRGGFGRQHTAEPRAFARWRDEHERGDIIVGRGLRAASGRCVAR